VKIQPLILAAEITTRAAVQQRLRKRLKKKKDGWRT